MLQLSIACVLVLAPLPCRHMSLIGALHAPQPSLPFCDNPWAHSLCRPALQAGGGIYIGLPAFNPNPSCGDRSAAAAAAVVRVSRGTLKGNLASDSGGGAHVAAGRLEMTVSVNKVASHGLVGWQHGC